MTTTITIVVIVLVVLIVAALIAFMARRAALRRRFGPEYDRAVADNQGQRAAERELRSREREHAKLELRTLSEADRERFTEQWRAVQTQFVLDPAGAVVAGDNLVTQLMNARGYPTGDYDNQLKYLSVEHARTLGHYRDAHEIFLRGQQGQASTEELRQALVHYRELVADLLDEAPQTIVDGTPPAQQAGQPAQSVQDAQRPQEGQEVRHGRA
jgi:hypothetical protein